MENLTNSIKNRIRFQMVKKIQNTALVHENKIISENVKKIECSKKITFYFLLHGQGWTFFFEYSLKSGLV